jgi:hypothetical protein
LQFRKSDSSTLTTNEISEAYKNKQIRILYTKVDGDIKERNYDSEKYVKAAMWRLGWASGEAVDKAAVHCMPTFVHVSDLHGDFKRFENAVEYANMLQADAILASGDHVLCYTQDENSFMKDILDKHPGIPMATCIGNHETTPRNSGLDNSHLFNHHISMYVEQGNYNMMINNLPVFNLTIISHPLQWGFLLLGMEYGYSWYWAMKIILLRKFLARIGLINFKLHVRMAKLFIAQP